MHTTLPMGSSMYFNLFSGILVSPHPAPDGDTLSCCSKWGMKKVAAPASKNVLLMESSLIAQTISQPLTSWLYGRHVMSYYHGNEWFKVMLLIIVTVCVLCMCTLSSTISLETYNGLQKPIKTSLYNDTMYII